MLNTALTKVVKNTIQPIIDNLPKLALSNRSNLAQHFHNVMSGRDICFELLLTTQRLFLFCKSCRAGPNVPNSFALSPRTQIGVRLHLDQS